MVRHLVLGAHKPQCLTLILKVLMTGHTYIIMATPPPRVNSLLEYKLQKIFMANSPRRRVQG